MYERSDVGSSRQENNKNTLLLYKSKLSNFNTNIYIELAVKGKLRE